MKKMMPKEHPHRQIAVLVDNINPDIEQKDIDAAAANAKAALSGLGEVRIVETPEDERD
jgi:hypothetical protein